MNLQLLIPKKLIPVFEGYALYRGAYGGRGSAKTRTFAKMAAAKGVICAEAGLEGAIICGREFQNTLQDSSFAEVKSAILEEPLLEQYYEIGQNFIRTKCGRINFSFIGLRHNAGSIKSTSKIRLLWVDEADPVAGDVWDIVDNTIREEGSELWVTWNPGRKGSATDTRFKLNPPPHSKIIEMNWRDNPCFPETLNIKRLHCLETNPDQYDHIWEGDYVTAKDGSYYAAAITKARAEHRIGLVAPDPLLTYKAFIDIGGTGAKSDAFACWITQFVGREIRMLDYYEAIGQPLAAHIHWLQSNGYLPHNTTIYLPHDGVTHDRVFDATYDSEFKRAGYSVITIKNQGTGAATQRIEALRKLFPSVRINESKCQGGIDALGWYHEKRDEHRNIGLGPEHDWSSHAADAAGLMAIVAEDIFTQIQVRNVSMKKSVQPSSGGWMG